MSVPEQGPGTSHAPARPAVVDTAVLGLLLGLFFADGSEAQWTHRYPKVDGFGHQVYLEGFELPVLGAGPTDPAPSPDGKSLAFAARGWLWLLDLESGIARRLTSGGPIDSRPAWSPDAKRIAFLRDDTSDLDIWVLDLATGEEQPLIETPAIELDPAYSSDGRFLYYTSGESGSLDVWRLQLDTAEPMRISNGPGIELRPLPLADRVLYISKRNFDREVDGLVVEDIETGFERTLRVEPIVSQVHPALSPDGRSLIANWPSAEGYELLLIDLVTNDSVRLLSGSSLPLSPAFSADGRSVYFSQANELLQYELFSISVAGGESQPVPVQAWEWGEPTGILEIRTTVVGQGGPAPARLHVVDRSGHPVVSASQLAHSDSSSGRVFQYSPGVVRLEVPLGDVSITATVGFTAPAATATATVTEATRSVARLELKPLWNPRDEGWYAGDHHYHLNYGGSVRLRPEDLLLPLRAEGMDVGTPLLANLHYRFNDTEFFPERRTEELPYLVFGQEVRSHFLGHLGLINISRLFWPWYWGPGYELYGEDDRPNHEALRFARDQGGVSSYMHPVRIPDPFSSTLNLSSIPVNLVPDAVLGDLDTLEIACLWTSELGTSELWYRLLNVGTTVAASAGTDIMADYYRSMAVGATRIYVKVEPPMTFERYLQALKHGSSFVSTGPLLDFRVDGVLPGEVVSADSAANGQVTWSLRLASPGAVEKIEILINGKVVATEEGMKSAGERRLSGKLSLPEGGWVAARAVGGDASWPVMNGTPFAHSSPIWIGSRGSTEPESARRAARDLLRALEQAETTLRAGYGDAPIPRLLERFAQARAKLDALAATE